MKNNSHLFKTNDDLKFAYPGNVIVIDRMKGLWSDLVLLYELKKIEGCTTSWNDQMMYPGSRDKMRVKNAVRLMSKTTANDLRTQFSIIKKQKDSQKPEHETKHQDTPRVVELLNDICNVTNGATKNDKKKPLTRCLVTKDSYHWDKWDECTKKLENAYYVKWNGTHFIPPCIQNTFLTMNSMRNLCIEMINEHEFESLNLRRMHQDVVENFFSCIRRALDSNNHPTAIDMMRIIKCLIISKFSATSSMIPTANETMTPIFYLTNMIGLS